MFSLEFHTPNNKYKQKGYTIEVTTDGVSFVEKGSTDNETPAVDTALNHSGIIPEGGTYITGMVWSDDLWD